MSNYLTKWSLTRRKIFTKCARRFAIKYLHAGKKLDYMKVELSPVSDWDLMIKTTSTTFFDLMRDAHQGKCWSENLIKSRLHFELITNLANSKSIKIIYFSTSPKFIKKGFEKQGLMMRMLMRRETRKAMKEYTDEERDAVIASVRNVVRGYGDSEFKDLISSIR